MEPDMLEDLDRFPSTLKKAVAAAGSRLRVRASDGGFAMVEHLCHLADLEREGYGARIELLLGEARPVWDDFDGAAIAIARNYLDQDAQEAYQRFVDARHVNLGKLRAASNGDWEKRGTHRGVGDVTLREVAEMMVEHDRDHAGQIATLLAEVT